MKNLLNINVLELIPLLAILTVPIAGDNEYTFWVEVGLLVFFLLWTLLNTKLKTENVVNLTLEDGYTMEEVIDGSKELCDMSLPEFVISTVISSYKLLMVTLVASLTFLDDFLISAIILLFFVDILYRTKTIAKEIVSGSYGKEKG